jgi:hypothetical protein
VKTAELLSVKRGKGQRGKGQVCSHGTERTYGKQGQIREKEQKEKEGKMPERSSL